MKDLQKSSPFDMASTSVRIEAPVVLKPEHVSKKALIGFAISPEITKGAAATHDERIQQSATIIYPSLTFVLSSFGLFNNINKPPKRIDGIIVLIKASIIKGSV